MYKPFQNHEEAKNQAREKIHRTSSYNNRSESVSADANFVQDLDSCTASKIMRPVYFCFSRALVVPTVTMG